MLAASAVGSFLPSALIALLSNEFRGHSARRVVVAAFAACTAEWALSRKDEKVVVMACFFLQRVRGVMRGRTHAAAVVCVVASAAAMAERKQCGNRAAEPSRGAAVCSPWNDLAASSGYHP